MRQIEWRDIPEWADLPLYTSREVLMTFLDEIKEWVRLEAPSGEVSGQRITFTDDTDAVKFKLRWC